MCNDTFGGHFWGLTDRCMNASLSPACDITCIFPVLTIYINKSGQNATNVPESICNAPIKNLATQAMIKNTRMLLKKKKKNLKIHKFNKIIYCIRR